MGKIDGDTDRLLTDATALAQQYDTTDRLSTRSSVWRDTPDGRNPRRAALAAVVAASPSTYLEIGCGTGDFAAQVQQALPDASVLATDRSNGMALAAAQHGVVTQVVSADDLPYDDDSFDVVYAGWMLYHVPDVAAVLREVRRVLRPGGSFVAATNGDDHMADLLSAAGSGPVITGFSSQNAQSQLEDFFDEVSREEFDPRAVFENHDAAVAYLNTFDPEGAARLPRFEGAATFTGQNTVFVAK